MADCIDAMEQAKWDLSTSTRRGNEGARRAYRAHDIAVAKQEIRDSGRTFGGDGLATVGLILGYSNLIVSALVLCGALFFFGMIFIIPLFAVALVEVMHLVVAAGHQSEHERKNKVHQTLLVDASVVTGGTPVMAGPVTGALNFLGFDGLSIAITHHPPTRHRADIKKPGNALTSPRFRRYTATGHRRRQ